MKRLLIILPLVLCFITSCHDKESVNELKQYQEQEQLEANNIKVVKEMYKYFDEVNLDSLRSFFSSDHKIHFQSGPPVAFDDMEPVIKEFYTAFPDYIHGIEDIIAVDDKVIVRIDYSGTHEETFMGIEPSGTKFSYKGIHILQLSNDKIINLWAVEDQSAMVSQLGMELKMKEENE